jgi:hypothetical protein
MQGEARDLSAQMAREIDMEAALKPCADEVDARHELQQLRGREVDESIEHHAPLREKQAVDSEHTHHSATGSDREG